MPAYDAFVSLTPVEEGTSGQTVEPPRPGFFAQCGNKTKNNLPKLGIGLGNFTKGSSTGYFAGNTITLLTSPSPFLYIPMAIWGITNTYIEHKERFGSDDPRTKRAYKKAKRHLERANKIFSRYGLSFYFLAGITMIVSDQRPSDLPTWTKVVLPLISVVFSASLDRFDQRSIKRLPLTTRDDPKGKPMLSRVLDMSFSLNGLLYLLGYNLALGPPLIYPIISVGLGITGLTLYKSVEHGIAPETLADWGDWFTQLGLSISQAAFFLTLMVDIVTSITESNDVDPNVFFILLALSIAALGLLIFSNNYVQKTSIETPFMADGPDITSGSSPPTDLEKTTPADGAAMGYTPPC